MLDNRTGDMFRWLEPGAAIGGGWAPVGNVGLHAAFGKVSLGKASDVSLGSALSEINRSDGVGSCEVRLRGYPNPNPNLNPNPNPTPTPTPYPNPYLRAPVR